MAAKAAITRRPLSGEDAVGVESFGQVLQRHEAGEQQAGRSAVGERRAESEGFGNEVRQHGHELAGLVAARGQHHVEAHEDKATGCEADHHPHRREVSRALGHQHQRDRRQQSSAAERDHAVANLVFEPARSNVFEARQQCSRRHGQAGHRGQPDDRDPVMRASVIVTQPSRRIDRHPDSEVRSGAESPGSGTG
jgi:hypothetical protein